MKSPVRPRSFTDICRASGNAAEVHCLGKVVTDGGVGADPPQGGLGADELLAAHDLPRTGGGGKTLAVIATYDSPNAEAGLAVYRATYGLPACTSESGCFKRFDQRGGVHYPAANVEWAAETALDLAMASVGCPDCNLLLIEADGPTMSNVGAAVNSAVALGADAISNSFGGSEDANTLANEDSWNHPGVLIAAAAGDEGYGAEYPATSAHVVAVGGTSLVRSASPRGWEEVAWQNGGSGCSKYIAKPAWQTDKGCSTRMSTDVAVVSGSNGTCSTDYFCNAASGYDGPTGWGTPNGVAIASIVGEDSTVADASRGDGGKSHQPAATGCLCTAAGSARQTGAVPSAFVLGVVALLALRGERRRARRRRRFSVRYSR